MRVRSEMRPLAWDKRDFMAVVDRRTINAESLG
jgi:hypothetical protein